MARGMASLMLAWKDVVPLTQVGMMPVMLANSPPVVDWVQPGW